METPPPVPPPSLPPSSGIPLSQWKVILHLSGLAGLIAFIPVGNIVAPLIIWLIKKTEFPELDLEGRKVLNFQISFSIYFIVSAILTMGMACLFFPVPLFAAVGLVWLIFTIIGGIKASNNEPYEYPLTMKFL